MGGWVSVGYALDNPERLNGLVLIGGSGADIKREGSGNLAHTILATPVLRDLTKYITPRSLIERSLKRSVSNQAVATPEAVDRYWEMLRYPGNRQATLTRMAVPRSPYTKEQMSGLTVPTLLIWGEEDALVPFAAGQWYEDALPNATLVAYPNIGHLPMEETPTESASALTTWMTGLTATPEN
jgi:pimeloyl-ACP methyl ester carboxylesterase